ncbi:MAG: Glycosyl transferase family 2 [Candidatus Woesebacteria bacterium GW2011_GWB1_38_8]|uniref:Glycosyl transferase family 2 n=1 Tax=Candidatus Woesebacteria bacterium GW2011_GWB1_38_8 TaxID=1618570 RepID=A0A0G0LE29_9BACT|nr:MAG: Glycosyl transferase family 2 [Candidatus Woesebacteria bacterium GW2011_GWB1_38_8]
MQYPKISVVIPSYNKAKYISGTLESIVRQKYPDIEVIIQDPGSTDASLEIIKKFTHIYPKIFKLYTEKDRGQLDAINKGLKKAGGELLTYINADDIYEEGALMYIAEAYISNPKALWFAGRGKVIDDRGSEIAKPITIYKNLLLLLNSYNLLLMVNYLMQPSVFLTRNAYIKFGEFTGTRRFVMEYEMWLRLGRKEMPVVIPQTLSSFRLPQGSISRTDFEGTLGEDYAIVLRFTRNLLILALHRLHSLGRRLIVKII